MWEPVHAREDPGARLRACASAPTMPILWASIFAALINGGYGCDGTLTVIDPAAVGWPRGLRLQAKLGLYTLHAAASV
jgi:hypothetical protein